jgi:hypothetical protein
MHTLKFISLVFVIVSCTTSKTTEAITDTISSPADSTAVLTSASPTEVTSDVSANNISSTSIPQFPSVAETVFSEFEQEAAITPALIELIDQYDTIKFFTITRDYSFTREVGNDYDETTEAATETESKTWYYDRTLQLRAYAMTFQSDHIDKTELYLFNDGNLAGAYLDFASGGQDTQIVYERYLASQCPACGVQLRNPLLGQPMENQVTILSQENFDNLSNTFFIQYGSLTTFIKGSSPIEKDDRYELLEKITTNAESPYTVTYSMDSKILGMFTKHD